MTMRSNHKNKIFVVKVTELKNADHNWIVVLYGKNKK